MRLSITKLGEIKKPWDKWPDETDLAYHRFSIYLKLGPKRSLEKVGQELGKSRAYKKQLEKWSVMFNWVERAGDYDRYLIRESLKDKKEILEHARGKLLKHIDDALEVIVEIMMMENYSYSEGQSSNLSVKLKAAENVLKLAGVVPPEPEDVSKSQERTPTYVQINEHINQFFENQEAEQAAGLSGEVSIF